MDKTATEKKGEITKEQILPEIIEIISDNCKTESAVKPDDHLINAVGVQSLDFLNIIIRIEERYHVTIEDEQHPNLTSANLLADYVLGQLN
jgi:acyl carrier protein